ncbi:MAG TPA: hypothetical protein ENG36_00135 [Lentisphaerae bacterium]|nr:hypothetical protein [Lentisphaerota bacterium]
MNDTTQPTNDSDQEAGGGTPEGPPRIKIPRPAAAAPKKGETTETKRKTTRVPLPDEESLKKETLPEAPTAYEAPPAELEQVLKKSTVRIEPADEAAPEKVSSEKKETQELQEIAPDVVEASKKSTVRVELEEERPKGDTQKVARPQPEATEKAKTARVDMEEVLTPQEEEDIFKKRTVELPVPGAPPATGTVPRTIKVKKPAAVPPTAVVRKPQAERPPTEEIKAKTSRIDMPREAVAKPTATRKKSIKIKRPGTAPVAAAITAARPTDRILGRKPPAEEAEVPALYSILAAAALLVSLVLIYVLAAQSIAPGLPFPGRLP